MIYSWSQRKFMVVCFFNIFIFSNFLTENSPVHLDINPENNAVPYLGETIIYKCIAEGITITSPPQWLTPEGEVVQPLALGKWD